MDDPRIFPGFGIMDCHNPPKQYEPPMEIIGFYRAHGGHGQSVGDLTGKLWCGVGKKSER